MVPALIGNVRAGWSDPQRAFDVGQLVARQGEVAFVFVEH